jgi:hypothetical protein
VINKVGNKSWKFITDENAFQTKIFCNINVLSGMGRNTYSMLVHDEIHFVDINDRKDAIKICRNFFRKGPNYCRSCIMG